MEKQIKKLKVTFCSGAGTVTGANFLIEARDEQGMKGKKFLVDCGLVQGEKVADDQNWDPFPYNVSEIDYLFVTHAHVDHLGRIPKLIADGFKGKIYSTPPTLGLAPAMLEDTMSILARDHEHGLDKIYTKENVDKAISLWEGIPYHRAINIEGGFTVTFRDAGHILGSAMVEIVYNGKNIIFTGDLGNSPSPFLPDTEKVTDADYVIMESVYGDRNHESRNERKKMLESVIEDNYRRKGSLIMPTFSLERTQELLFEINDLVENRRIPEMPIFLDSPLAIRLTTVYRKFADYFSVAAQKLISAGDDIFTFPGLKVTVKTEESKMILTTPDPKIIIAGSGMSNGGRIVHHEQNYLPNENNTLLLTGYQSPGTLGRILQEGAKSVFIAGQKIEVNARVVTISGYSGHKDSDALLNFVEGMGDRVQKIFVVMGEPKSELFLVQRIRDFLGLYAYAPQAKETIELEC